MTASQEPSIHPAAETLASLMLAEAPTLEVRRHPDHGGLDLRTPGESGPFAEAERAVLRVVPFVGDRRQAVSEPFVNLVTPSHLGDHDEVVVNLHKVADERDRSVVLGYLREALAHWAPAPSPSPPAHTPAEAVVAATAPEAIQVAQLHAEVATQWSWASAAARIPQLSDVRVDLTEDLPRASIKVAVTDGAVTYGSATIYTGALEAGPRGFGSARVPLSAQVLSQVDERRGAHCAVELVDDERRLTLARVDVEVDVLPRDLWLWSGDPKLAERQARMRRTASGIEAALREEPGRDDAAALRATLRRLRADLDHIEVLSRSLLASFVRPNHPEVGLVAREAATRLGAATGDSSFSAFQRDPGTAEERCEASVTAIWETLQARRIAYSEPPPGWDYRTTGQRIRDHGEVARGGLGTCMDTTVLLAAVLEQVGLLPVMLLVPGHILVGYWRHDPTPENRPPADWYPDTAVVSDPDRVADLVGGGHLGLIETTMFTDAQEPVTAAMARAAGEAGLARGVAAEQLTVIDVAAARRAGVSPLPAVTQRSDGVTEVVEYRPGGAVAPGERVATGADEPGERRTDPHPARYRTWKSSLFALNAANALLNLRSNAKVQPLALPAEGLGILEDRLHQDVSFAVRSGQDVPAVWAAREQPNALLVARSDDVEVRRQLIDEIGARHLYVQRLATTRGETRAVSADVWAREMKSLAHAAKTSREEKGMNPLFLCLGTLRWQPQPGKHVDAPLILVPVELRAARGRSEFTLALDTSQHTSPNVALIELLKREHGLVVPGLSEPMTDKAGIDVDGVLREVREAISRRGLDLSVRSEARLALLDLSAFRMWQDLEARGETFMQRPLVKHLVESPTAQFHDPVLPTLGAGAQPAAVGEAIERLEAPVPADATQKRAVVWARQGRTFVLQGPPGTGKSQTITNMVAECLATGMRVLFVAEKGTALEVVQRRLDAIGLGPFTLNLHHEGSNATVVREQLRRSLDHTVVPDPAAAEDARRKLRAAAYPLASYPEALHRTNAAGLSAYSAHDELIVLGDGPEIEVPRELVTGAGDVGALRTLMEDLQPVAGPARPGPGHPWRFAGRGSGDPFDVAVVSDAVTGLLGLRGEIAAIGGHLGEALSQAARPEELTILASGADPHLPPKQVLDEILAPAWPAAAEGAVADCSRAVSQWRSRLHGYPPEVLGLDLRRIEADVLAATSSGFLGRSKRQLAALAPLAGLTRSAGPVSAAGAGAVLRDLVAVLEVAERMTSDLRAVPGLRDLADGNPFDPGTLPRLRARIAELVGITEPLRGDDGWSATVRSLAGGDDVRAHTGTLTALARHWSTLGDQLQVEHRDLDRWRSDDGLLGAFETHAETWARELEDERLLPLQQWCRLMDHVEPLRAAGLDAARDDILDGRLPAYDAADRLARGIARASRVERVATAGLDRFDGLDHDRHVGSFATAQAAVRRQWETDTPARMLAAREHGEVGTTTGGLARELGKTRQKLGTRALLRKHGAVVQHLTPLTLCSPASVVDLIEPGVMDFDLVIFDEASQITVPEAVGALGRASAAIVVGDSKQMPPTRRVGGSQHDDDLLDDPDAEEIVEDQESILSECEQSQVPTLTLSWHYRSQDEALIAFSNTSYYRGELSSFPTPTLLSSATGVEFRRVDGQYLRAGSPAVRLHPQISAGANTNPAEAEAVVDVVRELLAAGDGSAPTVGVVTFNEQQRTLIEELLHRASEQDDQLREAMDEARMGRSDILFVKALEQVQGDERDVIVFSVAFSKQANGKIPTNFGPLSNSESPRV